MNVVPKYAAAEATMEMRMRMKLSMAEQESVLDLYRLLMFPHGRLTAS
jgi:hypothetical protein